VEPWERREQPSNVPDDHFVIYTVFGGALPVSAETARDIEASLDQVPQPRWIRFRDLSGGRQCLRTRALMTISEDTAEGRALSRAINRARKAEEKAEKDWSDDTP